MAARDFMKSGYVYAPYVPMVVTPTVFETGVDESLTRFLPYPVSVLGTDGVQVGDLVKILLRKGQGPWDKLTIPKGELEAHACGIYRCAWARVRTRTLLEAHACGIYLGSEEFTPRGVILNSKVCIRHVFNIGSQIARIEEGSGWVVEVMNRVAEAE